MVTLASPVARQLILAEHVANTTGFLLGTAGFGQLGRLNDINDASNYSVIIGNQDTTNGLALRVTYGTTASATLLAEFTKPGISFGVQTAFKQVDLTNPASTYTAIGARASDGRPVYYANGGSQILLGLTTDSVPLSTFIAAGDIVQATGSGAVARLGIGTARFNLQVNAGATALTYASSLQSLMTAQGDIVQASAANTPARLAIGTARFNLAVNSGATALEYVASMQSLLTAQGQIIYASAANTPAALTKGTAGQALVMNAGATAPEWATNTATRNQVTHVIGSSSGPTQASGTYAVLAEMTITLTTTGGDLLVWFVGTISNSTSTATTTLGIRLDGATAVFEALYGEPVISLVAPVALVGRFTGVSAASHTVDIVWKVDSGTATAHTTRRTLMVMES